MPEDNNNELLKKLQRQVKELGEKDSISSFEEEDAAAEQRQQQMEEMLRAIRSSGALRQAQEKESWYKQYIPNQSSSRPQIGPYSHGQGLGNQGSGATGQTSDYTTPKGGYGSSSSGDSGGGSQSLGASQPAQQQQTPQQPQQPRTSSPPGSPPTPFTLLTPTPKPATPTVAAPLQPPTPPETPEQKSMRDALGDKYDMVKPYLTPENSAKYGSFLNTENIKKYKDYITPQTLQQYLGPPPAAKPQQQPQQSQPQQSQPQQTATAPVIPKATQVGKLDFPKMERPPGSVGAMGYPRLHVPWENKQQPQQLIGQTPTTTQQVPRQDTVKSSAGVLLPTTPADEWLASRMGGVGGTSMEGALKEGYNRKSPDLKLNYAIRSMSPETRYAMQRLGQAYERDTGKKFFINSAYRSPKGTGSSMASGKGSMHGGHGAGPGHGVAFDIGGAGGLGNLSPEARDIIDYAQKHPEHGISPKGLKFSDAGHLEYSDSRKGQWGTWNNEQRQSFQKGYSTWMEEHRKSLPQQQQSQEPQAVKKPQLVESSGGGKSNLQRQVYQAYRNAGLSEKQAIAITAEVGRENDYNPKMVFGSHRDSGRDNYGFLSWNQQRGQNLMKYLTEHGAVKDGEIIRNQQSLDLMAKFSKDEIREKYPKTAKEFLDNPNVDYNKAAQVLGGDYIRWDMAGRRIDATSHARRRDRYREQLIGNTEGKDETSTPARKDAPSVTTTQPQSSQYGIGVMNNLTKEDIAKRPGHAMGELSVDIPGREKPEVFSAGSGGWGTTGVPPGRFALNPQERASGITRYYQKSGIPTSTENEFGTVYNVGVPSAGVTSIPNDPKKFMSGGAGDREAIQIHAGSDVQRLQSQGCFVVDKSEYPRLVRSIEEVRKANGGKATLIVNYDKEAKKYSFKITGPNAGVKGISTDQAIQNQQSTGDTFGKAASSVQRGGISRPEQSFKKGDINRPEQPRAIEKSDVIRPSETKAVEKGNISRAPEASEKRISRAPEAVKKEIPGVFSGGFHAKKGISATGRKIEPKEQAKFSGATLDTTKIKPNLDSPRAATNKRVQDSAVQHNALPAAATKADTAAAQAPHATEAKNPAPKASATPMPAHRRDTGGLTHNWTSQHTSSSAAATSRVENTYVKPKTGQDHSFSSAGLTNV